MSDTLDRKLCEIEELCHQYLVDLVEEEDVLALVNIARAAEGVMGTDYGYHESHAWDALREALAALEAGGAGAGL